MGQRLYTARRQVNLSVAEVADVVNAAPRVVAALEAEQSVSDEDAARMEALVANLAES